MPLVAEDALVAPREPLAPVSPSVAAIRLGSADALAAVYHAHAPRLLRLCARLLGSVADAEDVLHDVFLGLPELLARYQERGEFDAWLRAVTVRAALGHLRTVRRRGLLLRRDAGAGQVAAPPRSPWDAVDLAAAIAALPDSLRAVFVLKQLEGYSHDEIAALLDITPGASRVRLVRALEHLRRNLEHPAT